MHEPTDKTREFVKNAARARESKKSICSALGICHETFQKYYKELYEQSRQDIPNLATNVLYEFLSDKYDDLSEKGRRIMRKEQAVVAEKVMRSHGWKQGYEIDGVDTLPAINVTVLPKDETDV